MARLTLDADLRSKLNGLDEAVEVCDESGQTVGHFLPSALYDDLFYAALSAENPHSAEELRRRHHETGGRALGGNLARSRANMKVTVVWRLSAE